jgi:hypothetical protein
MSAPRRAVVASRWLARAPANTDRKPAAARSGLGWDIVDYDADPPHIDGDYVRDEDEQVRYMRELFTAFDEEDVDTAFWFTFASYHLPHHDDPRFDLDMAAFGVCKVMRDGILAPKRSFHALAGISGPES